MHAELEALIAVMVVAESAILLPPAPLFLVFSFQLNYDNHFSLDDLILFSITFRPSFSSFSLYNMAVVCQVARVVSAQEKIVN